jgi:hypothetical protein
LDSTTHPLAVHPDGRGTAGEADGLGEVEDEEVVVVVGATEVVELEADELDEADDEEELEAEDEAPAAGPANMLNLDPAPQVCCEFPAQIMLH